MKCPSGITDIGCCETHGSILHSFIHQLLLHTIVSAAMLKCFSFRYETLQEDDYSQLTLSAGQQKSDSPEKGIKDCYGSPETVKKSPVKLPTSSEKKNSINIASLNPKQSWQLEKKEEFRKQQEFSENSQRYTPLPVTQHISFSNHVSSTRNPSSWSCASHLEIVPPCQDPKQSVQNSASFRRKRMSRSKTNANISTDSSSEWPRAEHNSSNKSGRDWLHPTKQLLDEGVHYNVRYIGCLDINTSMKSLNFETRSQLAKECLYRVCETAGLKTVDKKRKVNKKINKMLAEKPNMLYAGSNVNLVISSTSLTLTVMESNEVIANHEMPNISFASAGDADTLDFIAYVAKDGVNGRACYVLECGGGLAQDVMITIGQAFQLRYNECIKHNAAVTSLPRFFSPSSDSAQCSIKQDDPEYYNDLPGKIPPEAVPSALPLFPEYQNEQRLQEETSVTLNNGRCNPGSIGNLIDLSSEPSSPNPLTKASDTVHEYMNDCMVNVGTSQGMCSQVEANKKLSSEEILKMTSRIRTDDPFDMRPFSEALPQEIAPLPPTRPSGEPISTVMKTHLKNSTQLTHEVWFHGSLSRKNAEALLQSEGDFLVRESQGSPNQYVLSGMNNGIKKHLLLVDPEGVVRTKDKVFDSVSHLVNFHKNNRLPIISVESALILQNPIICVNRSGR